MFSPRSFKKNRIIGNLKLTRKEVICVKGNYKSLIAESGDTQIAFGINDVGLDSQLIRFFYTKKPTNFVNIAELLEATRDPDAQQIAQLIRSEANDELSNSRSQHKWCIIS